MARKGRKPGSGVNGKLAKALKVTEQRVSQLRKQGMPITSVKEAMAWVGANVQRRTGAVANETQRLRAAQANRIELELAHRSGRLAPIEDMQIAANEAMVILRSQVDAVASRCAAQLAGMSDPAEIRQFLLHENRQALAAAAARLEDWARMVAGSAASQAAAVAHPGSVGRPN